MTETEKQQKKSQNTANKNTCQFFTFLFTLQITALIIFHIQFLIFHIVSHTRNPRIVCKSALKTGRLKTRTVIFANTSICNAIV